MRLTTRSVAAAAALSMTLAACSGDAAAITSLADATDATIGVQSATTGEEYANENAPEGATIQAFENPGDLLTALQAGTVDAVLQDLPVNAEFVRNNEGFEVVEEYDTNESYGFAVAEEGADNLLAAVNSALAGLRGEFYDALFDKYFGTGDAPTVPTVDMGTNAGDLELIEDGKLIVCSDIPYAPFEFEENGEFTGFDIELITAIATSLGLETEILAIGFDPIQSGTAMNSGQCDIAASAMTITEEREANLDFTDGYYDAKQSLLVASA